MRNRTDPVLVALTGSETRARTLGVLANAERPMTGYRVAKLAGLPEIKVYEELKRAKKAGIVRKNPNGWILVPADLRNFLQVRFRVYWAEDWDRARKGWAEEIPTQLKVGLAEIRRRIRENPYYLRPKGWAPPAESKALEKELRRRPEKDALLRRRGRRTSQREDWPR